MKNFKQQLDREMGPVEKRFTPAMQERIMQKINEPTPKKMAWPYVMTMVATTIMMLLLSVLIMFPATQPASTATSPLAAPIKSFHINSEPEEDFFVSTSLFSLGTPIVLNKEKIAMMQMLLSHAQKTDDKIDEETLYADITVAYDTGKERSLRLYSEDDAHYLLYDVHTHETFAGVSPKSLDEFIDTHMPFEYIFILLGLFFLLLFVANRIVSKRFGIVKRKEKSVSKKQNRVFLTLSLCMTFYTTLSIEKNIFVYLIAYGIFLAIDFYFEYRYAHEERQYILSISSSIMMCLFFVTFYIIHLFL
ncbi:MAG: hypothetical protein ACI4XN_06650 [Candidatus Kurthia intestinigallinarum]